MYCEDYGFQGFGVPENLETHYKNFPDGIDDSVGIGSISEADDLLYSDERVEAQESTTSTKEKNAKRNFAATSRRRMSDLSMAEPMLLKSNNNMHSR